MKKTYGHCPICGEKEKNFSSWDILSPLKIDMLPLPFYIYKKCTCGVVLRALSIHPIIFSTLPLDYEWQVVTKECPYCNSEVVLLAKFCEQCGAKFHQENKCPSCSTIMPDGAKFCSECGAKLI